MRQLFEKFRRKADAVSMAHVRDAITLLVTEDRLIGIKDVRGVDKTTLLLQYANSRLPKDNSILYMSSDTCIFRPIRCTNWQTIL